MQKRNWFLKIGLIVIIAIIFLLIMQGKAMANDESWEGEADGLGGINWWQDQVGEVYTGENYGIKWEATITQTNNMGGQVGRVSFKVTNPEEISGEIEEEITVEITVESSENVDKNWNWGTFAIGVAVGVALTLFICYLIVAFY